MPAFFVVDDSMVRMVGNHPFSLQLARFYANLRSRRFSATEERGSKHKICIGTDDISSFCQGTSDPPGMHVFRYYSVGCWATHKYHRSYSSHRWLWNFVPGLFHSYWIDILMWTVAQRIVGWWESYGWYPNS